MKDYINEEDHDVEAYYSNGPEGYLPVLGCSCGFGDRQYNWEDAGVAYDKHFKSLTNDRN